MKPLGLLLFPLLGLLSLPAPANATDISAQAAVGRKTPIAVGIGSGHTIDFSQTGEQIFRGWLGDGGRCLVLSPSSPLETGAAIINLRRITPCQEINGLPNVAETTLTLVSMNPAGDTNIYEFSINYGATGNSLTRLVPGSLLDAAETETVPELRRRASLSTSAVELGLATFELAPDSPVSTRVAAWLDAVGSGQGQRIAAQTVSVDWALLERLEAIGQRSALLEGTVEL